MNVLTMIEAVALPTHAVAYSFACLWYGTSDPCAVLFPSVSGLCDLKLLCAYR